MLYTITITYNKTISVLMHACEYYDLESKKNELTSQDFVFYLCFVVIACFGFGF